MAQVPEIEENHFDGQSNIGRSKGDNKFLAKIIQLVRSALVALETRATTAEAHAASDGTSHANVVLNDTHRASDGKDHSDVVTNTSDITSLEARIAALEALETADGGKAIWMINKTGANSVKGTLVEPGSLTNSFAVMTADGVDPIGVVYDSGIADGQLCRVVVSGKAYALLEDTTASTVEYWCRVSENQDGRVDATNAGPPGGTVQALETHAQECGHSLETVTSGTDKLMLMLVHFN